MVFAALPIGTELGASSAQLLPIYKQWLHYNKHKWAAMTLPVKQYNVDQYIFCLTTQIDRSEIQQAVDQSVARDLRLLRGTPRPVVAAAAPAHGRYTPRQVADELHALPIYDARYANASMRYEEPDGVFAYTTTPHDGEAPLYGQVAAQAAPKFTYRADHLQTRQTRAIKRMQKIIKVLDDWRRGTLRATEPLDAVLPVSVFLNLS